MTSQTFAIRKSGPHARLNSHSPAITVVVASNRPRALLNACLASLVPQCERGRGAHRRARRNRGGAPRAACGHAARSLRRRAGVCDHPDLRGLGMAESTGDIVALTEDHCVADGAWVETLLQHSQDGADVIGGGMGNAQRNRVVDQRGDVAVSVRVVADTPMTDRRIPCWTSTTTRTQSAYGSEPMSHRSQTMCA